MKQVTRNPETVAPARRIGATNALSAASSRAHTIVTSPHLVTGRQVLTSVLLTLLWLGLTPIYVGLISPYVTYTSARTMTVSLALTAAVAPYLWRSRTAPWRTILWTALPTAFLGSTLLMLGAGRYALMAATLLGFGVVAFRANQNGRKLVALIRTFWHVR